MKKTAMVIVLAVTFALLTTLGCSGGKSAAERFLASHDETFFEEIFVNAHYFASMRPRDVDKDWYYTGFRSSKDISSNGLYNFFLVALIPEQMEQFYNQSEKLYHIPTPYINQTLSQYLEEFSFDPTQITDHGGYSPDGESYVTPVLGGYEPYPRGAKITKIEAFGSNHITISADSYTLDPPITKIGESVVTLFIPNAKEYKIESLHISLLRDPSD